MSPVQASAGTAYLQGSGEAVPGLLHLLVLVTVPVLWLWPCCFSLSHGCQTACPLPTETPVTGSETPSSDTSEYIPPPNRGGLTFYGSQILKGTMFSPAEHHGSISSRAPPCCSAGGHRATGEKMEAPKVICPQKQCTFGTSSSTTTSQDPQICLHHSHYFPGNPLNPTLSSPWATHATVWANATGSREPRCYSELGPMPGSQSSFRVPAAPDLYTTDLAISLLPCTTSRHSAPCPQLLCTHTSLRVNWAAYLPAATRT